MKVSIVIPVYNIASYIEACLQSVMRQTYKGEMECLILDDCGTDESIPIAERLIAEYKGPIRFEIIHHVHNRGLSAARNTGMMKAMGEYILFVDGDDEITEDCVEKMMAIALDDPAVELVQGRHMYHRDGNTTIDPKEIKIAHACTNEVVRNCFYQHEQVTVEAWNKLMKRSVIQENHLSFADGILYEDILWTFYWLKYVKNAHFLSDVTYHYKVRPHSIVTGTAADTIEIHRLKGYRDIIAHLTPGHENQEIAYYTTPFVRLFLRHSYHMPELTDDLRVFWRYARQYKQYKLCAALAICYTFRKQKRVGRWVYAFLLRVMRPQKILKDFKRL